MQTRIDRLLPKNDVQITEIPVGGNIRLYVKREDLIHPEISGNKFWKLYYNLEHYLQNSPLNPQLITLGGAYSNHIASVAAFGKISGIKTMGIIRGEELEKNSLDNPTLSIAQQNGMKFRFVSREIYRDKNCLYNTLKSEFPNSLIIPEGGTDEMAVEGIKHMLSGQTKEFDYLCTAVGTGGTVAGLSKFCEDYQRVVGFSVVRDLSLQDTVQKYSGRSNYNLVHADEGGYGKINDGIVRFINDFYSLHGIPLDPVYTGKMMKKLLELIASGFFPEGSRILAFHTGGLQGIAGANQLLKKKNRALIDFEKGHF